MDTISEYIDFSDNEELWQEVERRMEGLGQCVFEDGLREGLERGREEGQRQAALNMRAAGMPEETIAYFLGVDTGIVQQWFQNL